MNDLRFASRQLLKNPGFTAVTVLTLALGVMNELNIEHPTSNIERGAKTWSRTSMFSVRCSLLRL